ncbi:hypothetical protein ACVI1T_001953 [Rhizobium redzepovicii]
MRLFAFPGKLLRAFSPEKRLRSFIGTALFSKY